MLHIFKEVNLLRQEGLIHQKLISRVRILFIISLILGCISAYNFFFKGGNVFIIVLLAIGGFILGLTVFSRMSGVVRWNEDESLIQTEKMDKIGFAVIALYIVFEIGFRTFLRDVYPASATTFILAGVFGTLLGRAIGTVIEVHRVFMTTHDT